MCLSLIPLIHLRCKTEFHNKHEKHRLDWRLRPERQRDPKVTQKQMLARIFSNLGPVPHRWGGIDLVVKEQLLALTGRHFAAGVSSVQPGSLFGLG